MVGTGRSLRTNRRTPAVALEDFLGGEGCYLCDPKHPYRLEQERDMRKGGAVRVRTGGNKGMKGLPRPCYVAPSLSRGHAGRICQMAISPRTGVSRSEEHTSELQSR